MVLIIAYVGLQPFFFFLIGLFLCHMSKRVQTESQYPTGLRIRFLLSFIFLLLCLKLFPPFDKCLCLMTNCQCRIIMKWIYN